MPAVVEELKMKVMAAGVQTCNQHDAGQQGLSHKL
jgi:hypothetical protein